ncbi:hypothetical protein N658DRAFT_203606 [Parathielavia hyrcaniae]|uniref:Uncharacterized protein n=1 Tax=Parathielavia hyrcaniae TaxID=113614 RepID=A0AAN6PWE8_9PEZI|nr:hypothetical protein N658DRAFT_203606 [Parathielavia hyrcaniae]
MESFNDAEKRFVLAEMIKLSQVDVGDLVDFVKSHGIEPDWLRMQLPSGRTMGQCLHAAETMFNTPMPPPPSIPTLKRKSLGDLPDFVASKRQAVASPGEVSPRGPSLSANPQPGPPANIQPHPNGFAPAPPTPAPPPPVPSISASPYNPTPVTRKRGRPPKAVQGATWQVSTYPPISPAPIAPSPVASSAPQPHSPGLQHPPGHQAPFQGPDPKARKKALPEIAPRPTYGGPGSEPPVRSPAKVAAAVGGEYQSRRDETSRREYYQAQGADAPASARDRPTSMYAPILPRPELSPELARPASVGPRRDLREPPPRTSAEPLKNESRPATTEPIKT